MILDFTVTNQVLKRKDSNIIVNKSKDYLRARFDFETEEWEGLEKFAIFKNNRCPKSKSFSCFLGTGMMCECQVPPEALIGSNMRVSVYAGDRITTSEVMIVLLESGYDGNYADSLGEKISYILEKLNIKFDQVVFEDKALNFYSEGVLIQSISLPFITQEDLPDLLGDSFVTRQDLIEIQNQLDDKADKDHTHVSEDIADLDDTIGDDLNLLLDYLTENI